MSHPERAAQFLANPERADRHDRALWFVREKRDLAAATVPEWEHLRALASEIKRHTLARLADYLEEFETNATRNGAVVHWAADASEHNEIVLGLLAERGVTRVVKSKSMLTEECGLNPYLEAHGLEVTDTDLGERIIQFRKERPSHIIFPAIHMKREDVSELFAHELGSDPGVCDPSYLVAAARVHLRQKFLEAEAGITGVNFAVAETGGIVVCTNEGNADLGTSLPPLHIACMGIEKVVPRARDLGVFLRLLARSATGQAITAYTSHFHGPRSDGELHIVLVDNGRSALHASADYSSSLACIRCGACMNTCPVFRRSGGHSYDATVPGPIGSILEPARDPDRHRSLPFACTLCGSCKGVCPVKIDLPQQLLSWRRDLAERGYLAPNTRRAFGVGGWVLRDPLRTEWAGRLMRLVGRLIPSATFERYFKGWSSARSLPEVPRRSFRAQWKARSRAGE